jgi:polysaccharide biosynthesis/export protein
MHLIRYWFVRILAFCPAWLRGQNSSLIWLRSSGSAFTRSIFDLPGYYFMKRSVIFLLFVFILSGVYSVAAQPPGDQDKPGLNTVAANGGDDRYRIGFQDVLNVQVFRHPDLNQTVPVSPAGTIILFRLDHPVVAVCKTDRELALDIQAAYGEKYLRDPQITVTVAKQESQAVSIIGSINTPGRYFVTRRIHLLELLALAGGPNKEAGTRIIVFRSGISSNCKSDAAMPETADGVSVMGYKIRDIQEGKQMLWMKPGDVVSVLRSDMVYVYGNVNKQGALEVREPITLTQAIASAEGLKPATKKDHIRVLRQRDGATEREELVYDLTEIDKGKVKDPFLEPNDIVAVSTDTTKSIVLGITNLVKTTIPSMIYRVP